MAGKREGFYPLALMNFVRSRIFCAILLLPLSALAEPRTQEWDYSGPSGMPENWGGLKMTRNAEVKTPDGQLTLDCVPDYDREDLEWAAHLRYSARAEIAKHAQTAEIFFWVKGDRGSRIALRVTSANSSHYTATQSCDLTGEWQKIQFREHLNGPIGGKWISAPRLLLEAAKGGQHVFFGPLTFRAVDLSSSDETALPDAGTTVPAAGPLPLWKAMDTEDLYIKPGTALDLSRFFDQSPAGTFGRLIVNRGGELAFASKPADSVRFFSVQLMPPADFRLWDDRDIAEYAGAVARQGYNLVRFHFFDNLISGNDRGAALKNLKDGRYTLPEKPEEIVFDAHALDRFHLLLAELKKRGVYWNLDLMSSFVGYSNGMLESAPTKGNFNTKSQLYVNPNFRANWKAGVTRLLNEVNPYTKLALKDDPALALATCFNEQEILFEMRKYGREFDRPWQAFLSNKYGNYPNLFKSWEGRCGETKLPDAAAFADVPSITADVILTDTPAGRDMAACCGRMEYEMSEFYIQTLRELQFPGLFSNFNMRPRLGTVPARSLFPVITMNAYHACPEFGPDATFVNQDSALQKGGYSFKNQCLARFLDRPFVNTEFGHVFWNCYRHEQGLLHGAGAALQNWSAITCHAEQVIDAGTALKWFCVGRDPVIRAAEVVEALAFRRRDVAASPHTIEIPLNDDFIQAGRGMKALDDELSRLWVLCRIGITYGKKRTDFPVTLTVSPDRTASIGGSIWFSSVASSTGTKQLTAIVDKFRELGVLPGSNESNPALGILQSDTGEVTLGTGGELLVRTPRLEGAVLKSDKKVAIHSLTIERCSVPASITIASLDPDQPVANASRLLLVFSTDSRNTNMQFLDAKETKLSQLGTMPVLSRTGELKLTLTRSVAPQSVRVYALKLNGERAEEIPAILDGRTLSLAISTARLAISGPTPFFEIVF